MKRWIETPEGKSKKMDNRNRSSAPAAAGSGSAMQHRKIVFVIDLLLMLFAGITYSWSVFIGPLEAEFGWTRPQTSLAFTISSLMVTTAAMLAAFMAKKLKVRGVLILAAVCTFTGFISASRLTQLWQLYAFYSVCAFFGVGIVYNQVVATVVRWFRDKSGLVTGCMLMCYGIGSMILSPLCSAMVQRTGWRTTFFLLGCVGGALMLAGSFIVRYPDEREERELPQLAVKGAAGPSGSSAAVNDSTPADMVKTSAFWFFVFWNLSVASIGLAMSSHSSPIAQGIGLSVTMAGFFAGIISLCNGIGRVVLGVVFDRIGYHKTMMSVSVIAILSGVMLLIAYTSKNAVLLFIAFALTGTTFSGGPICSASYVKTLFGEKNYAVNYGFGNLVIIPASFIGPYLSGWIYQTGGYHLVFPVIALYGAISLVFSILLGGAARRYLESRR